MKTRISVGIITLIFLMGSAVATVAQQTSPAKTDVKKINLNVAVLEEVQALPGMTPELAQALLKQRPYQQADDLLKVAGMTQAKLDDFKTLVEVQKLNLNTANIKELKAIPDVTPEMAEAIVNACPYTSVEELLKVKGMTEDQIKKLSNWVEASPAPVGTPTEDPKGWQTKDRNLP